MTLSLPAGVVRSLRQALQQEFAPEVPETHGRLDNSGSTSALVDFAMTERKQYTELQPARSVYDNHLVSLLIGGSKRFVFKPWLLLVLNFIAQGVVVCLLFMTLGSSARDAEKQLTGSLDSVCFSIEAVSAMRQPDGRNWSFSCSSDEKSLFFEFQQLDLDKDGPTARLKSWTAATG